MGVNVTYSLSTELTKATRTATPKVISAWVEAVTGTQETVTTTTIAPGNTAVISLGGITIVKGLFVDAKIEGGTDDLELLLSLENSTGAGVAVQVNEIRFGSKAVVLDTSITSISITNLNALDSATIEVRMIGS